MKTQRHFFVATGLFLTIVTVLTATSGCGSRRVESEKCEVRGAATFGGKPILDGFVTFEPDVSKGNQGRGGSAVIRNGRYDTQDNGRGFHRGSVTVQVFGFDGIAAAKTDSGHGKPLFPAHTIKREFVSPIETLDIDVPAKFR